MSTAAWLERSETFQPLQDALKTRTVPTAMLETGARGEILRQLGLVQQVPNPGERWISDALAATDSARSGMPPTPFQKKRSVGPYLYAVNELHTRSDRGPYISEICVAGGHDVRDGHGDTPDWIELHNPDDTAVDLEGWSLTDDPANPTRWTFPTRVLDAGRYLIVFASAKDAVDPSGALHTNFKLDQRGEYLALHNPDGVLRHEFAPTYPEQLSGVSWGTSPDGVGLLERLTPGAANSGCWEGIGPEVVFSHETGWYTEEVRLALTTEPGFEIWYTLDGRDPARSRAQRYRAPLRIFTNTVIRATARRSGFRASTPETRTFLFLDGTLRPQRTSLLPKRWGETKADYGMDHRLVERHSAQISRGLLALPFVSVVADPDDLFGEKSIYSDPRARGIESERPAFVEMVTEAGETVFRTPAGVRMQGNESRRPDQKKHSLRFLFRSRYGASKLEADVFPEPGGSRFDTLALRSADDSWLYHQSRVRRNAQYVRDQWARDTHRELGHHAARGRFVHLFLNGLYWGLYNLVERPDAAWIAEIEDRDKDEYDALRFRVGDLSVVRGSDRAWREMMALVEAGVENRDSYAELRRRFLDPAAFIDYLLVHLYNGGEDWSLTNGNNLRLVRLRRPEAPFHWCTWDADSTFASGWGNDDVDYNIFPVEENEAGTPSRLFHRLLENPEFREEFRARAAVHLGTNGVLSATRARVRYESLCDVVADALWAEAARWGDVRRPWSYTPDGAWSTKREWMRDVWFPQRTQLLIEQLTENGLWPDASAALPSND